MRKRHRHPHGHWCNCPWGSRQLNDPIDDLWDIEKYGSEKFSWVKNSAKLDWLRDRPDMQGEENQAFLDTLGMTYSEHDPLFPWLARERKKGRVGAGGVHNPYLYGYGTDEEEPPLTFIDHEGNRVPLDNEHLNTIKDWMAYKKKAKSGVDIMQHHIGDAIHESDKWDGLGEVLHEATEYPGWTVKLLRDRRDLRREGERMNHCVGGYSYHKAQARGESAFYSVRDRYNRPHATLEMNADHEESDPRHPHYADWSQGDYYGKDDGPVPWEAQQIINEYFGAHGHSHMEPSEEEEEEPEFEPWWDSYYYVNPPSTPQEYIDHANGEYLHENAPEEYHRAHADADSEGYEGPDLEIDGEPDFEDIFNDFMEQQSKDLDPERIREFWQAAHNNGHWDEIHDRAQDWLNEEYKQYLDPYGQQSGPGYGMDLSRKPLDPHAPPRGDRFFDKNKPAPELEGSHYPGRAYPHDEHLARNLEFHIANPPNWSQATPDPQGEITPSSFFIDRAAQNERLNRMGLPRPTDLPPHLFPPDKYSWVQDQVHPQQMPMWSARDAYAPGDSGAMTRYMAPGTGLSENPQSWDLTKGELAPETEQRWNQNTYEYYDRPIPGINDTINPGTHPTVPWQASYHPREDDEWVDADEPEFSATQPEPRWGVS